MAMRPQTQFVRVGDADVAYQVLGEGPPDLLLFAGVASHVELNWQVPDYAAVFRRFASFSRLILFDRRGSGASDPAPPNATWEELAEDLGAVLDAVGSERAAILGAGDPAPIALIFTALHPDRVANLILVNGYACTLRSDDYPIGTDPDEYAKMIDLVLAAWGSTDLVALANPSRANDPEFLDVGAAINRASATPRSVAQYVRSVSALDVRPVLPLISAPTLVLHSKDYPLIPIEHGRYVADRIEGARFVELPCADFGLVGENADVAADEIAEFLTGQRPTESRRRLASVLFTDIVSSTATAASIGDRRWRLVLDSHDRAVREQLARFGGREVSTTGDGFMACFDGPARAIRCAQAIIAATSDLGIELRTGLHTGECEVRGDDLGGMAVHIAARVGALSEPGQVRVSGTVKDLVVGSGIEFDECGEHELKGVPGTWKLFAVRG
jgi:class 3 adenylate cyclase